MKFTLAWGGGFSPTASQGWTIHFIEWTSRYWVDAQAGVKDAVLFETGVQAAWDWANPSEGVRWFTDGERRYGKELWKLASVYLSQGETTTIYPHRKVWRKGLEVAVLHVLLMSPQERAWHVNEGQRVLGKPHVEWLRAEHPLTAISPKSDVHANHNEAQNSSLRRRASAYHRSQNHYAKVVEGLQRVLDVQRLIHNWVRPHWGLKKNQTPAMAMGYFERPVTMLELLSSRGLKYVTS